MRRTIHVGDEFGRWTVIAILRQGSTGKSTCRCECGTVRDVSNSNLLYGQSRSCGCLSKDVNRGNRYGVTHGLSKTRLYHVWSSIVSRCYNHDDRAYENYGGRGIVMCDEWRNDFKAFYDWAMSNGYDPSAPKGVCTIDRIDNDGIYSPENCRWVDMQTQSNNTRCCKIVTYKGNEYTIAQLARKSGMGTATMWQRLSRGMSVEEAVETPLKNAAWKTEKRREYRQAVNLVDSNENIIAHFESISDAASQTGQSSTGITNTCKGIQKSTGGMIFRYADTNGNSVMCSFTPTAPPSTRTGGRHSYKVDMLDLEGNLIQTFNSQKDAAAFMGKSSTSVINRCCRGRIGSAYGYVWRYSVEAAE